MLSCRTTLKDIGWRPATGLIKEMEIENVNRTIREKRAEVCDSVWITHYPESIIHWTRKLELHGFLPWILADGAFSVDNDPWEFYVLPFGLCNVLATFEQ